MNFRHIWTVWSIAFAGSFLVVEYLAWRSKIPGSVTLSQFGWHLMQNRIVNVAIITFLIWVVLHFAFKGRIV